MKRNKNMKKWPLFTIGYEGYTIEDFANYLKAQGNRNLVDVRQYPKSRKPGFSKSQLEDFFASNGIKYYHIGRLGSPVEIRKKVREDNNYKQFFQNYASYLEKQTEPLSQLADIIKEGPTCIFCLEADYNFCHRKTIAAYLNVLYPESFIITHL
jgi:uncharacterized protein (DUF488 family)